MEDYENLSAKFMNMCGERPELLKALRNIIDEQATSRGIDLEKVRRRPRPRGLSF